MNEGMASLVALIIIGWLVAPLFDKLDKSKREPVRHIGFREWARKNKWEAGFCAIISTIPITSCTLFFAGFFD